MGIADRKAREFQQREQDILEAAKALSDKENWNAVTIDNIAEKAEIGKGTVYKHFKSKDEVCARLVADHMKLLLEELRKIPKELPFVPRFKEMLKVFWRVFMDDQAIIALQNHCEITGALPDPHQEFERGFEQVHQDLETLHMGLIQEGIDKGIFPDQPLEHLRICTLSAMKGAMFFVSTGHYPEMDKEAFLDYLCDFVIKGLMNASSPLPGPVN